jgi:hypothetical protein
VSKTKAERTEEPARRARVVVIWEDTREDAPRTWSVGLGTISLEHVEHITLIEHEPECNSGMLKAKAVRLLDEMNLVGEEP